MTRLQMTLPPPECKVYTPPQLADAMVGSIDPRDNDFWLDPCIGPGAFVAQLRKRGISKDRIVGIDIDPEAGREDRAATTLRGIDFFELSLAKTTSGRKRTRFTDSYAGLQPI